MFTKLVADFLFSKCGVCNVCNGDSECHCAIGTVVSIWLIDTNTFIKYNISGFVRDSIVICFTVYQPLEDGQSVHV